MSPESMCGSRIDRVILRENTFAGLRLEDEKTAICVNENKIV
jgi:hypothetical protein